MYIYIYICIYTYISHRNKQFNGNLIGITFVMLVVDKQVALIRCFKSETHLLVYVHEKFAMSLHLFLFSLHYYICSYYYVQTTRSVGNSRRLTCCLTTFIHFALTTCVLIYISPVATTSS